MDHSISRESGRGFLPEVSEDAAPRDVAEIYTDIRACGFPIVNLVYRTLATKPETLKQIWRELAPNFSHGAIDRLSTELIPDHTERVTTIPGEVWPTIGVQQDYVASIRATLSAYKYANSRNLLGFHALLNGVDGTGESETSKATKFEGDLLPLHDLASLSPSVLKLVETMSRELTPESAEELVIPSLLRHFVDRPCVLAFLWTAITPGLDRLTTESVAVRESAERLAQLLPYRVRCLDDNYGRSVLKIFSKAAANMLVVGRMFECAIELIDSDDL